MILTEKEARSLMDRVLSFSTADETRINIYGGRSGNTRFALNSITTSGYENTVTISVTSYFGKRHATAITTEIDDESLKEVVKKAEILARYSPEDPEYVPELGPQQYLEINSYFQQTANAKPSLRAEGVLSCIKPARERDLDSSGFFIHDQSFEAVGNNKGLFGYHKSTNSSFSATVRTPDGTGSGWASYEHRDIGKIDYEKISDTAISKAENSANPEPMDPGEYPVILEPQAVYDIILFSVYSMDARSADEGRSFFSRPGEANKIGEKIVNENITIYSDPTHPQLLSSPFGSDGLPSKKLIWIERGVLKQLYYSRYWAEVKGKEPTGFPSNIIFKGGDLSFEEILKSTHKAILVTRFWYIRYVDPQTLLLTGLTRDGTFWVEGGEIKKPIKNFRFNESPISLLKNVEVLSKPVKVGNSMVPAIKAAKFTFSSLSEAV